MPTTPEIRAAVALIHEAVRDPDANHHPIDIAAAHTTLIRASRSTAPPVKHWLTAYIAHDAWHSGPEHLTTAIDQLARNFKLPRPVRVGPPDGDQGTLF